MTMLPPIENLASKADLDIQFVQVNGRITAVEDNTRRVLERMDRFDDRLHEFHKTMLSYARTFLVVQTATVFSVSGIVLGITQLP